MNNTLFIIAMTATAYASPQQMILLVASIYEGNDDVFNQLLRDCTPSPRQLQVLSERIEQKSYFASSSRHVNDEAAERKVKFIIHLASAMPLEARSDSV